MNILRNAPLVFFLKASEWLAYCVEKFRVLPLNLREVLIIAFYALVGEHLGSVQTWNLDVDPQAY